MTALRMLVVATRVQTPGTGIEHTHLNELLAHLREHGPVLALAGRSSHGRDILDAGLWSGLPPPGLRHMLAAANLARSLAHVRAFNPTVIYEQGASFGLGAFYSRLLNIPMLVSTFDQHFSRLSLRRARFIVTLHRDLIPTAYQYKAVQMNPGINIERFHPDISGATNRIRHGFSPEDFVVAYCGTFKPWHGLEHLVRAAEQVPDPTLKFLLIGDVRQARNLPALVRSKKLTKRFVFTGRVPYDQVPQHLAAADVCVAPFDLQKRGGKAGQGQAPLKVVEYLALEKPVIASQVQSLTQLFRDGHHLHLVPPRNPQSLATALQDLRRQPERAAELARTGRQRVLEHHTWSAQAGQLASLFRRMLTGDDPPLLPGSTREPALNGT